MTLILTRSDVASVLALADCVPLVEEAFRRFGEGSMNRPQSLGVHASAGTFHIKAAMADVFAVKINANFPDNPREHDLPTIQGVIVLMDTERGVPLAIVDSTLITTLRTAAATAVAAKHLARADATAITVIGCGVQGRESLEAIQLVRPIKKAYAVDRDAATAGRFADEMRNGGVTVLVPASLEEAIADSDIVVTATTSRSAILHPHHLHPGLFIAAVGADNPEKQELAPELLKQSRVVVDILEQAATMGDLHHALKAGTMTRAAVHGELSSILSGQVAGRRNDDDVFVFDSTGTALQDVAVASFALSRAQAAGRGYDVAFA